MNKFLIILCTAICAVLNGNAFVANPVMEVEVTKFGLCLQSYSSEAYTYQACYLVEGSDATYTIYDYEFNVTKKFTLENVVSETSRPTCINRFNDEADVIVSRGVFTQRYYEDQEEEQYCVVFHNYEENRYIVYNDRGDIVGELPQDDDGEVGYFMMSVATEGPTYYVTQDSEGKYTFWNFDEGNGVNEIKAAESNLSAYPNPLHGQQTLTIKLPHTADSDTVLTILDTNGLQSITEKVEAGQSRVEISGGALSSGINVYSLRYSNGKTFSGKLIKE